MKTFLCSLLSIVFVGSILAQSNQIQGKITDAINNSPIPNATIRVSGFKGTNTNKNGEFSLNCSDSIVLNISCVGYESIRLKSKCNQQLNIQLQLSANNLNTVEITATSNPNKSILYQPQSISRIGITEVKRGTGLLLDDAINANIAGVYMQRRTFSAGQQFNIRGYGNGARGTNGINNNFDGQGYKVYLNGIPITDAEGISLMDDIDFGSIGNVEVIKGPAGTIYGQAIAGVVNLTSIKPQIGTSIIGQDIIVGSYGLKRSTTSMQFGREKSSILVNYGKQKYDGFAPHTNSDKDFVNAIGEFELSPKQTLSSYVGYSKSYDERNGELTPEQFDTLDYSGNPAYISNNAHSNVVTVRTGLSHIYRWNKNIANTSSIYGTGLISNVSSAGGWTDKSSINYGFRSTIDTKFELQNNYIVSGITGIEVQSQNAQTLSYPMLIDSFNPSGYKIIGTLRSNQYTATNTVSAFSEWSLSMPNDWSLTAGFGISSLNIELNDRFFVASNNTPNNPNNLHKPTQFKNSFNSMFSPHFAINKVIAKQVSAYAAYSKAYKAPVSSYFFVPTTGEVLTDLKPEVGTQFEIGTKGSMLKNKLNFQVAAFYTQYLNKFTIIAVPNADNTATSYVYVANAGNQINTGLELTLKGVVYKSTGFIQTFTPFANMAYSIFKYGDFKFQKLSSDKLSVVEVDFSNKIVAGVPPFTANLGFDITTRAGLYMNTTFSYRDKMYYTSDNLNETKISQLWNAKVGYSHSIKQKLGFDVFFGINNITNHQNYAMVFINQLPDAYIPSPKTANYFGGIQLKYFLQ